MLPCFLSMAEDKMLFKVVTLWHGLLFLADFDGAGPSKSKSTSKNKSGSHNSELQDSYLHSNQFLDYIFFNFSNRIFFYFNIFSPSQEPTLDVKWICIHAHAHEQLPYKFESNFILKTQCFKNSEVQLFFDKVSSWEM